MEETKEIKFAINKNKSLTEIVIEDKADLRKEDNTNPRIIRMNIQELNYGKIKVCLSGEYLKITKNNGTYTFKIA
jgi:hypothetical protein